MAIERINLLGVSISAVTPALASEAIGGWIESGQRAYVCVAPVATLVDSQRDVLYREVLNRADMVTPDGMPVVWLARLRGNQVIRRTYGPDLLSAVCADGQAKHYRHFFYGASEETCRLLQAQLRRLFPDICIAGHYSPPFQAKASREQDRVLDLINKARPDIVWVGLGSPKQDFWMQIHRPLLDVPVLVGIGAAFDFVAGVKPQAPRWVQRSGLEWFFRLCCEPRRLWRRYLVGNSLFIYYVVRDLVSKQRVKSA